MPVMVARTPGEPASRDAGVTDVMVGAGITLMHAQRDVPPSGLVTVMIRVPSVAVGEMAAVSCACVAVLVTLDSVMSLPAPKVTPSAKLLPVIVIALDGAPLP